MFLQPLPSQGEPGVPLACSQHPAVASLRKEGRTQSRWGQQALWTLGPVDGTPFTGTGCMLVGPITVTDGQSVRVSAPPLSAEHSPCLRPPLHRLQAPVSP